MKVNIANIFSDFIGNVSDELKSVFDKFCLGNETENALSFKEYLILLRKSLRNRTDLGRRRVVYNRLDSHTYLHNRLLFNMIEEPQYVDSIYIATEPYIGKYPEVTMKNYEYFTSIVFLIHNDISKITEDDKLNLRKLAAAWYEYSIGVILGITYPKAIYRYANKDEIYHSSKKLNTSELRKLKIYTNRIFGKEQIAYE